MIATIPVLRFNRKTFATNEGTSFLEIVLILNPERSIPGPAGGLNRNPTEKTYNPNFRCDNDSRIDSTVKLFDRTRGRRNLFFEPGTTRDTINATRKTQIRLSTP